jgi:hypothetical protein
MRSLAILDLNQYPARIFTVDRLQNGGTVEGKPRNSILACPTLQLSCRKYDTTNKTPGKEAYASRKSYPGSQQAIKRVPNSGFIRCHHSPQPSCLLSSLSSPFSLSSFVFSLPSPLLSRLRGAFSFCL